MDKALRVAVCQINATVGDLEGNRARILERYREACRRFQPDLAVFPELCLPGYPPEDLLLRESFVRANLDALKRLAREIGKAAALVGFVDRRGGKIFNAAALLQGGKVRGAYRKQFLPNYGVFDEKRYFQSGSDAGLFRIAGVPVGVSICEDLWFEKDFRVAGQRLSLAEAPWRLQARRGAKVLINISASPFYAGKFRVREKLLRTRARQTGLPLLYSNLVGGQDELVFDGRSFGVDARGRRVLLAKGFEEDLKCVEFRWDRGKSGAAPAAGSGPEPLLEGVDEVYRALVLGTRDYVKKNGFRKVVIGLSGGIDSALTACLAAAAVGEDRVVGVTLPSRYSSRDTREDARKVAENLGLQFLTLPIEGIFKEYLAALAPAFAGRPPDLTEENLQSRIRGTLLMALSNKFGHLVITTGNKSEVSVGYCTLYGDTAGGFAVLKDVPKTLVYELSRFVNAKAGREIIPPSTLDRAPTAELRANQKDQDILPPYGLLDRIIQGYVEEDLGFGELARRGYDRETLAKVLRWVDLNEYKRRQSPPGVKITPKSFGKDRRMPITNRFRESGD